MGLSSLKYGITVWFAPGEKTRIQTRILLGNFQKAGGPTRVTVEG